MKKVYQHIILLTLILGGLVSCTEKIDIKLKKGDVKLVVEGYLFQNDSVSWVRLTKSAGYFSDTPPEAVKDAIVSISSDLFTFQLNEKPDKPGYYFAPRNIKLPSGKKYRLNIVLAKAIGNKTHYEASTMMPKFNTVIDSVTIELIPLVGRWLVRLYAKDSPGKDFYMFNSMFNNKLITDTISRKIVIDDVLFNGQYIKGIGVQILYYREIYPGKYYTLIISEITKEYYDFVTQVQDEIRFKDPIFSGPPSNVITNISNGAVGFFTAYPSIRYRVLVPAQP